ncbi:MAG: rRNA maturation RNase YbeY [Dichotomicrobium sp.]
MSDPDPGQSTIDTAAQSSAAGVERYAIDVLLPEDQTEDEAARALAERLRGAAQAALDAASVAAGAVTVALTDDEEMRALNRQFRGADKPTNVLSFPEPADAPRDVADTRFLGDVILARETVAREAEAQGKTFADHASHLVVHGVLHLLGYTHDADADAARMEAVEIAALARLGLPDPYAETDLVES